jgi:endopeptidase La
MDFEHTAKRTHQNLLDENTQTVISQHFTKDINEPSINNNFNNNITDNYYHLDNGISSSDCNSCVDEYNSLINTIDNQKHQFFNINSDDDDDDNDDDNDDDDEYDTSSVSSSSSSSDSSLDGERPYKKNKKEDKDELLEEIKDLKKDIIYNSDSYDHIEIALKTLKDLRNEFPIARVSVIISKFKGEMHKIKDLNDLLGNKLKNNIYIKYQNAYEVVYKMLLNEYKKSKEKLNIIKWTTQKISERKKLFIKPQDNKIVFTFLNSPNENTINIPGWGGEELTGQSLDVEFEKLYKSDINNKSVMDYFRNLKTEQKEDYIKKLKNIKNIDGELDNKPYIAKIIECNTIDKNKSIILSTINTFENMKGSETQKLKNWITKMMKVPLGKYVSAPVNKDDGSVKIKEYLRGVRKILDTDIYGHDATKQQLIKILAHTIANPCEGGNIFALQGPPGVGKTALIQDGISKALGRPFTFICLGGATDACFLEGHDYTYEGSNHGRIIELLQQAGCMNPVIYFDELDKVSETPKGEEIINILMHITDTTQNSHFNDKYFGGVDFDLSKAIIIFSFNDEQKISRILRDRMKIIRVKGYKMLDKINIAKDFLLPKLMKHIGLNIDIQFKDDILEYIIDTYTNEGGVRKLKETLNDILLEINLRKLEDDKILNKKITDKLIITKQMLETDFLKKKYKIEHIQINNFPQIGQVNGLWANEYGIGGLIPIECCWIPAKDKLKLELTGMQGKVMQESMSVARTIAWRILPDKIKESLNNKWSVSFDYGIHIHCPDGATPKDGPSAGGAITTCLISLLSGIPINNKIAMTGEINLKGHITKIGGLEEKIFGAKKAGAELVLCPHENLKDLDEIKEKFPNLFSDKFSVKTINDIWEILDIVLIKKFDSVKF